MIFPANSPTNPFQQNVNPFVALPTPNNPSVIMAWVQGETGALSYPMAPNTRAYLFDMNEEQFFVRVSDITGVVQPLRTFRYQEELKEQPTPVEEPQQAPSEYITRSELREELERALSGLTGGYSKEQREVRNNGYKKGDTHHGKQTVRGTNESRNDESV